MATSGVSAVSLALTANLESQLNTYLLGIGEYAGVQSLRSGSLQANNDVNAILSSTNLVISEVGRISQSSRVLTANAESIKIDVNTEITRLTDNGQPLEANTLQAAANTIYNSIDNILEPIANNVSNRVTAIDTKILAYTTPSDNTTPKLIDYIANTQSVFASLVTDEDAVNALKSITVSSNAQLILLAQNIEYLNIDSVVAVYHSTEIDVEAADIKSTVQSNITTLQSYLDSTNVSTIEDYFNDLRTLVIESQPDPVSDPCDC